MPFYSYTPTAAGMQDFYPVPVTWPIDVDDPQAEDPGYERQTGDGKPLQLGGPTLNQIVKRGWEPFAFDWSGTMENAALIYQYTASAGPVTELNEVIVADPPIEASIFPAKLFTANRSSEEQQPDFTYIGNILPQFIGAIDDTPPTPYLSELTATGVLGTYHPIAFNPDTLEEVGAYMVVEVTLECEMSPYIWSIDGDAYCYVSAIVTAVARPARNPSPPYDFYEEPWVFNGIDEISQELVSSIAQSIADTGILTEEWGQMQVDDSESTDTDPWGTVKLFTLPGFTGAINLRCLQHYVGLLPAV